MNWLLIAVILLLIFGAVRGFRRGFLRVVFSLVALIVLVILVSALTPKITTALKQHTKIYDRVETWCLDKTEERMGLKNGSSSGSAAEKKETESSKSGSIGNLPRWLEQYFSGDADRSASSGAESGSKDKSSGAAAQTSSKIQVFAGQGADGGGIQENSLTDTAVSAVPVSAKDSDGASEDTISSWIQKYLGQSELSSADIEAAKQALGTSGKSEKEIRRELKKQGISDKEIDQALKAYKGSSSKGAADINKAAAKAKEAAAKVIAQKAATVILSGIAFLIALIIGIIIIKLIERTLDFVNEIPVIGRVNRVAGIFAGGFEALILVWAIMLAISLAASAGAAPGLTEAIQKNAFLQALYDNNLIAWGWSRLL